MDFTREPIIETVITPKEGCKLVVRSTKTAGQDEHFVDAVEVVSFGQAIFFRSTERPKAFLLPASDYEVLEVREARMVLKNVGVDKTIKIAGGREGHMRSSRDSHHERSSHADVESHNIKDAPEQQSVVEKSLDTRSSDGRSDKKKERRRPNRRRRGRDDIEAGDDGAPKSSDGNVQSSQSNYGNDSLEAAQVVAVPVLTALLPPPPMLISETIARYKDNALFKDAFYTKDDNLAPKIASEVPKSMPFENDQVEVHVTESSHRNDAHENEAQERESMIVRKRASKETASDEASLHVDSFAEPSHDNHKDH